MGHKVPLNNKSSLQSFPLRRYSLVLAILWTFIVLTSLFWNIYQQDREVFEMARVEARSALEKDLAYRYWASVHGGVYVPVTETTPPNPYLSHIEERDITTPSGRQLTLVNPAYMTRQVYEMSKEKYGPLGHLTSLKPISSRNVPDAWETKALQAFERGVKEISSMEMIEGKEYLRLMWPFITEEPCLKCHARQGYRVGDIRGGLSVAVNLDTLKAVALQKRLLLYTNHAFIWLLGLLVLGFGLRQVNSGIKERQKYEESLRKFQFISDNSSDAHFLINREAKFQYVNKTACAILGYSEAELLGLGVPDVDIEYDISKYRGLFDLIQEKKIPPIETTNKRRDGSIFSSEITVTGLRLNGIPYMFAALRDITERKKAEEDLRQAKADLEKQNEELKVLDKMKDRLLSDVSHELKTPVAKQRMQVDLLKRFLSKKGMLEEVSKTVKTMEAAIERQESVIKNILTLSRLEQGRRYYELAPTRIDQVLLDTLKDYQSTLESCDIAVKTTLPPLTIISDGKMLYHVFSNLINNAIKFRRNEGVPSIEVLMEEQAEKVAIKIIDNGIGFPEQEGKHIFERFYQASASTPGSGIGLTIAQMIVTDLKGNLRLESAGEGEGTTSVVELPLRADNPADIEKDLHEEGV